jgi:DNA-binding NarL/FixJ family response regulator
MKSKIRLLSIEDQKIVREGVNFLLAKYDDVVVIKEEPTWDRIEEFMRDHQVNLIILDLQLFVIKDRKVMNGFDVCELLRHKFPQMKLIAHSMFDSIEHVNRFFSKGGNGFVSKKSGYAELYAGIKSVFDGKRYVCPEIMRTSRNAARFLRGDDDLLKATSSMFTPTESNVLEKIAKGFSTKQIAHQLKISEKTVETHRKHLFDKAHVKNVAELIAFAYSKKIFME